MATITRVNWNAFDGVGKRVWDIVALAQNIAMKTNMERTVLDSANKMQPGFRQGEVIWTYSGPNPNIKEKNAYELYYRPSSGDPTTVDVFAVQILKEPQPLG